MSLMQMSISGAVMILAVIVIRAFAINRLPKKTFIALWGIVLLRLLVPFSLPSPYSAYSLVNQHFSVSQEAVGLENVYVIPVVNLPAAGDVVIQGQMAAGISACAIAWGIGFMVCVLFFAVSYFMCRREFRESLPIKNDYLKQWIAEHKLSRPIQIRQSSRISAPLTYGVFKPVILMPKNMKWDDTKQMEYILAHEFVHIRHFDAAAKLLLTAALSIHWFNPLVWAMYILSNRDIELSCDETVVRSFGETTKSTYARMLISMEEKKSKFTLLCNSFSKNAIEERITAIMKLKKTSAAAVLAAFSIIISVTTAFATSATPVSAMENTQISATINPIRISGKEIAAGGKISLGSQFLLAGTDCKVLLTFTGDKKLTVQCTSTNGVSKTLQAESGKAAILKIEAGGDYTVSVKNDNAYTIGNVNGTIEFIQCQGAQSSNMPGWNASTSQTVTYSNVQMRRYEGADGPLYIHDTKVNETTQKIIEYKYGMLAFDKDGNPLKINWWSLDTEAESTYFYLDETKTVISPGETWDVFGGWSLYENGTDASVEKIAYVLYCDKEIIFEDGTIWTNDNFDSWRLAYEGQKVNVNVLESYYPYRQTINFAK